MISIRKARAEGFEAIWVIFHAVVQRGDTYAFDPGIDREGARTVWMGPGIHTYVAIDSGEVVGTYIIKANQPGLGSHVANAAFMVRPGEQGKGTGGRIDHAPPARRFPRRFGELAAKPGASMLEYALS